MYTINCRGKLVSLETPLVMGVLNMTPDSFYKGFMGTGLDNILAFAGDMIRNGAAIIDIGGQSTRPGSERLSPEEELTRVLPVISSIRKNFPTVIISVDTYYSSVAIESIKAGADLINDISFGEMDPEMLKVIGKSGVPYIGMHMKGRPETMQNDPQYADVISEILDYFIKRIAHAKAAAINDIILDPGFGFGKTATHNMTILDSLDSFNILGLPLLAGLSRKNTICRILEISPGDALNGTTVLNTIALLKGASILRVHDVKEAVEAVKLVQAYKKMAPVSGSHL